MSLDPRESNRRAVKKYRESHVQEIRARKKAIRERNLEAQRAEERRYAKEWRKAHPERRRISAKRYSLKHQSKVNTAKRKWARLHPEVSVASSQRYQARKREALGRGVALPEWRQILTDSLGLCAYCGKRHRLGMDHIDPLAKGGKHEVENAAAACGSCNSSKNDRPLLVWLAIRAGERKLSCP